MHVECFFNLQTQKKPFHSLDKRQSKQFLLCSLWKYEMCPPFATLYAPHFFLIYFSISKLLHLKLLFLEKSKTSRFFLARQILVTFSLVLHYFNKRFHVWSQLNLRCSLAEGSFHIETRIVAALLDLIRFSESCRMRWANGSV